MMHKPTTEMLIERMLTNRQIVVWHQVRDLLRCSAICQNNDIAFILTSRLSYQHDKENFFHKKSTFVSSSSARVSIN